MITVSGLTKRFGATTAVDDVSFSVQPGYVTGFLGPNGAGKSTTMRMVVGLDRPTSGSATINGQSYHQLQQPLRTVGALLDAQRFHGSRSAIKHLQAMAATSGIPASRADEVLALVGLTDVAKKKVGGFSLGMRQRLGIAEALLGDPEVLLFDEPVNGLDPEGIAWFRGFARSLAREGRTVLVSSHILSEVAQTVDRLIVIAGGSLLADMSVEEFEHHASTYVKVRSPRAPELAEALTSRGATLIDGPQRRHADANTVLYVQGNRADAVGDAAAAAGIPVHELVVEGGSIEDIYLKLTGGKEQYRTGGAK